MANEITWRLEHERIGRLLLHYAMPAVIGTMVNALYNIVDRIFIGQGVGPLAMAGLTLTFPILLFLQAFGMLIGAGAATRVSIYLGRRENEMAENVYHADRGDNQCDTRSYFHFLAGYGN